VLLRVSAARTEEEVIAHSHHVLGAHLREALGRGHVEGDIDVAYTPTITITVTPAAVR
jgi:hypothetical protein